MFTNSCPPLLCNISINIEREFAINVIYCEIIPEANCEELQKDLMIMSTLDDKMT